MLVYLYVGKVCQKKATPHRSQLFYIEGVYSFDITYRDQSYLSYLNVPLYGLTIMWCHVSYFKRVIIGEES